MHKYEPVFYLLLLCITSLAFNSGFSPILRDVVYIKNLNVGLSKSDRPTENQNANFEILLGQTKYYQAIPIVNGLMIQELNEPKLNGGASDITFEVMKESRDTLGVYYDAKDEYGNTLPAGMIRLIGRYWDGGEPFKVRLIAKRRVSDVALYANNGSITPSPDAIRRDRDFGSVVIDVKSPFRLGSTNNTITDCFGKTIDLDSIIIKFAGENGIPPQLIKGQMERETHFKPDWRYEPAIDFSYQSPNIDTTVFPDNAPFWKTIEDPRAESWPYSHTHVTPLAYNDSATSIGKYIAGDDNKFSKYRIINADSIMGFNDLTDKLRKIKKYYRDEEELQLDEARKAAYDSLALEIKDTSKGIGKTYNVIAQTRITSSYGFVQMLYTTAFGSSFGVETNNRYKPTGMKYMARMDSTFYPEKLNELDYGMPRYCDFLLRKLHLLFNSLIPESQWNIKDRKIKINKKTHIFNCNGFEECWKNAIQLYNFYDSGYSPGVMGNSKKYLPQ